MTVQTEIEAMKETVKTLGIPEYFEGMTENDVLTIALTHYENYIKANVEDIKKAMYHEWCEFCASETIPEEDQNGKRCSDCGTFYEN